MIADNFLRLLRCPETQQALTIAAAEVVAQLEAARLAGKLCDISGKTVTTPLETGLLRADGARFFPVREGIPVLIAAESIAIPTA